MYASNYLEEILYKLMKKQVITADDVKPRLRNEHQAWDQDEIEGLMCLIEDLDTQDQFHTGNDDDGNMILYITPEMANKLKYDVNYYRSKRNQLLARAALKFVEVSTADIPEEDESDDSAETENTD